MPRSPTMERHSIKDLFFMSRVAGRKKGEKRREEEKRGNSHFLRTFYFRGFQFQGQCSTNTDDRNVKIIFKFYSISPHTHRVIRQMKHINVLIVIMKIDLQR